MLPEQHVEGGRKIKTYETKLMNPETKLMNNTFPKTS